MALVAADEGETVMLNILLDGLEINMHLFKNDYTPAGTSVVASFTECDFTDYAAKDLPGSGWSASTTNDDDKAYSFYADQTWLCGATGNTVYGYYMTTDDNATLLWAERFDSPRTLAVGESLTVSPKITLNSEN